MTTHVGLGDRTLCGLNLSPDGSDGLATVAAIHKPGEVDCPVCAERSRPPQRIDDVTMTLHEVDSSVATFRAMQSGVLGVTLSRLAWVNLGRPLTIEVGVREGSS